MMMATRSPGSTPNVGTKPVGQRAGDAVVLGERRPLVLVHQEGGVAVGERHVEHGPQRRGSVLPRPGRDAEEVALLHLEDLARCGERRGRLGELILGMSLAEALTAPPPRPPPGCTKRAAR